MATSNRRKQEDSSTSLVYHSRHVPESKEEASPVVENGNALNDPNDVSFSEEISQIHSNRSSIVQKKPISPISHQSKQNTFMNQQFEMLEEQSDMFTRKIETEKRKIEDLEKKIKIARDELSQKRKELGGVNAVIESARNEEKYLRTMENRLDKALVKVNETTQHNKTIRTIVDDLRRERVTQAKAQSKLEKSVHEKKKQLSLLVNQTNSALEQRDLFAREFQALEDQIRQESFEFDQEWRDIVSSVNYDVPSNELSTTSDFSPCQADNMAEEQQKLKQQSVLAFQDVVKKHSVLKKKIQRIMSYENALQQIKKETGIEDIEDLVKCFMESENRNYSLFNRINQINTEIESLEAENSHYKSMIEKYQDETQSDDQKKLRVFDDLEKQIDRIEQKAQSYEDRRSQFNRIIASISPIIMSIFQKVGCTDEALMTNLMNDGVTESNVMQFMAVIEQRTSELCQMNLAIQHPQRLTEPVAIPSHHSSKVSKPASFNIPPHAVGDIDDVSDDEDDDTMKPMSVAELKRRTASQLNKRIVKEKKHARAGVERRRGED